MALEDKIDALIEALNANTKALGGAAGKASTGGSSGKSSSGKASATKKKDGISPDDFAEEFGKYLSTGSKDDKAKAKKVVGGIIKKFDAERVSKIDPDDFDDALAILKAYRDEDEDPLELFDEDDDGGMM